MEWRKEAAKICVLISDGRRTASEGRARLRRPRAGGRRPARRPRRRCRSRTTSTRSAASRRSRCTRTRPTSSSPPPSARMEAVVPARRARRADVILGGAIEEMDLQSLKTELHERVKTPPPSSPASARTRCRSRYRAMSGGGTRSRRLKVPRLAGNLRARRARRFARPGEGGARTSGSRADKHEYAAGLGHGAGRGPGRDRAARPPADGERPRARPPAAEMPMYRGLSAAIDDARRPRAATARSRRPTAPSGVVTGRQRRARARAGGDRRRHASLRSRSSRASSSTASSRRRRPRAPSERRVAPDGEGDRAGDGRRRTREERERRTRAKPESRRGGQQTRIRPHTLRSAAHVLLCDSLRQQQR